MPKSAKNKQTKLESTLLERIEKLEQFQDSCEKELLELNMNKMNSIEFNIQNQLNEKPSFYK